MTKDVALPRHQAFGIPDELVDLYGPPPVAAADVERFFHLLAERAKAYSPANICDWTLLWDSVCDRMDLTQIRRGKRILPALYRERALKEIAKPGGVRFVHYDPWKANSPLLAQDPEAVMYREGEVDHEAAHAELKALGLDASAADDLARVLAQPQMSPLETLEQVRRNAELASLEELERRISRRRRVEPPPIQDAEFTPVLDQTSPVAAVVETQTLEVQAPADAPLPEPSAPAFEETAEPSQASPDIETGADVAQPPRDYSREAIARRMIAKAQALAAAKAQAERVGAGDDHKKLF